MGRGSGEVKNGVKFNIPGLTMLKFKLEVRRKNSQDSLGIICAYYRKIFDATIFDTSNEKLGTYKILPPKNDQEKNLMIHELVSCLCQYMNTYPGNTVVIASLIQKIVNTEKLNSRSFVISSMAVLDVMSKSNIATGLASIDQFHTIVNLAKDLKRIFEEDFKPSSKCSVLNIEILERTIELLCSLSHGCAITTYLSEATTLINVIFEFVGIESKHECINVVYKDHIYLLASYISCLGGENHQALLHLDKCQDTTAFDVKFMRFKCTLALNQQQDDQTITESLQACLHLPSITREQLNGTLYFVVVTEV